MANFTPTLGDYTELKPFRFWCQKVLPLVYDDSLSYYELLCKVVDYLNKTMEDVDTMHTDVVNLHDAYEQLQEFVNDYFDNLDVQEEINNKLDEMAQDGSLTALISPFIPALVTAWLNEHITPTTPTIDDTLTVSGAGADAKKTGSALNADKRIEDSIINISSQKETEMSLLWENGAMASGVDTNSNISQRTVSYIPLFDKKIKVRATVASLSVYLFEYDKDFNYLGAQSTGTSFIYNIYTNTKFVRISTYSTTIPQETHNTYIQTFIINDEYVNKEETMHEIGISRLENYIEGRIASFVDGMDSKIKEISILPFQQGSGVPSAENIRSFSKLSDCYLISTGGNMFPDLKEATNNAGIHMEKLSNGGYHFYGTATRDYYHNFADRVTNNFILPKGSYTLWYEGTMPGNVALYFNSVFLNAANTVRRIDVDDQIAESLYIQIPQSNTVDFTIYPYLVSGTSKKAVSKKARVEIVKIDVTREYYGAVIDLETGKLFSNYGHIASYAGQEISGFWMSDRDVYRKDALPTIGAEVVYQTKPEELEQIGEIECNISAGLNNVWSTVSDIGVKYESDSFEFVKAFTKYVTPEMFGAYGDGETDDTEAIQNCVNFAIKYGLDIHFNNNYFITKTISFRNAFGLNIYGRTVNGYDQKFVNSEFIIASDFVGTAVFEVSNCRCVKFDGISLKGYSRQTKYGFHFINNSICIKIFNCNVCKFQKGIYSFYSTYFFLERNNVSQCTTGIEFVGCGDSTLTDNYINTNIDPNDDDGIRSGTGILLSTGSSNNKIVGGKIEWNTKGVVIYGCEGILISHINFDFCPKGSIIVNGSHYSNNHCEAICITGCQFRAGGVWGSDKAQIIFDPTLKHIYASITGNIFQKAPGNNTTETDIGPETVLMTKGNGNPIALVFTGNNLTDGATTYDFVLNSNDEQIAYAGNLSNLERVINGENIVIN